MGKMVSVDANVSRRHSMARIMASHGVVRRV